MPRISYFALSACLLALPAAAAESASQGPSGPQGRTWAEIKQLPDWSGAWQLDLHADPRQSGEKVPFTPAYDAALKKLRAIAVAAGDSLGNAKLCLPIGPIFQTPLMLSEFIYQPGLVMMVSEKRDILRVYTDGRTHDSKIPPGFFGNTIGHWEGDTLVADTTNLRADGELFYAQKTGAAAKDLHIIERIHQDAPDHIRIDVTMTSSVAFSAPFHENVQYTRVPFPIGENVCTQNNRDIDPFGAQQFDLQSGNPRETHTVPTAK